MWFNALPSLIGRQKIKNHTEDMNDTTNQFELIDNYGMLYPAIEE